MSPTERAGKVAYEAYGNARGWRTASDGVMPPWDAVHPAIRAAWCEAAAAVAREATAPGPVRWWRALRGRRRS